MIYHKGFQSLLYYRFIHSKAHNVEDVAEKMGIAPSTLYGYIEGRSTFPVDLLGRLYMATKDPDFLHTVTNSTDYMSVPRPEARLSGRDLVYEAADVFGVGGQLLKEVEAALADGRLTNLERKRLIRIATAGLKECQEVINVLEAQQDQEGGQA